MNLLNLASVYMKKFMVINYTVYAILQCVSIKNKHELEPRWHVHVLLTLCNDVLLQDCKLMVLWSL